MPVNKKTGMWEGGSKSDEYLASRSNTPSISALIPNQVSHYRREKIADEVDAGLFREGEGNNSPNISAHQTTPLSYVSASYGSMRKNAQMHHGGGAGAFFGGHSDNVKISPEVYSPLWLNSNLSLPRDRATINAWCRSFYTLNPYVHNAINLHSTYPISKLSIKSPNKNVEKFFLNMIEEIDLMSICVQIAQEYWLLGEAFVYAELDESAGKWSRLAIQNPDYMIVKRTVVASDPIIMLRPDENLKKIIFSNRPNDIEQRKNLNRHIVDSVKRGENIPLDNFHVSHLARRISPYEIRGTGLPVCIFRQLSLFDKLYESKFAQADGMINPTTLVKLGGSDGFRPTQADIESFRETFEQQSYDKDCKIFTHDGVTIERIGFGQGIYDISGDITQLIKMIMTGLMVPPVLMDGGADTTYANGSVALDVLRQRYMQFRNMLSTWLKRKIFAPISHIQGFYDYSGGKKQLIIPEVDWNHMSLFDSGDYIQALLQLTQGAEKDRRVSLHTLYRSMGLEFEDETMRIRKESIQSAIFAKEKAALEKMDLNALRAIEEEDEIVEPQPAEGEEGNKPAAEAPLPGETPPGGLDLSAPPTPPPPPPPTP